MVRATQGATSFNTGAKIKCPYQNCGKEFAQMYCRKCDSHRVLKEWPYSFAHENVVKCSKCNTERRPSCAPVSNGTITFSKKHFAEGAFRRAFDCRVTGGMVAGFSDGTELVLKCLKPEKWNEKARLSSADFAMQQLCVEYAKQFNAEVKPTKDDQSCNLHMRPSRMYTMTEEKYNDAGKRYLCKGEQVALEMKINGEYEKFNSNGGHSWGTATLPDAFSHWTWVRSGGDLIVCDLQGHRGRKGGPKYGDKKEEYYYLLTDPAIVSSDGRFGFTDLGPDGIPGWFHGHTCNSMCESIGIAGKRPTGPVSASRRAAAQRRRTSFDFEF